MYQLPPRRTRTDTLVPYTTLCRSRRRARRRVGEQAGKERGVGAGHLGRALAEQAVRAGADPLRLAPERYEVQIGFEHLFVGPVRGEGLPGAHLLELGEPVSSEERRVGQECGGTCR